MNQLRQCPKCGSSMADGFVVDHTHGGASVSAWIEGAPRKSFWTGLKLGGTKPIDIVTWRCRRCGVLENYAAGE